MLYVVSTPIGNLKDITFRAIEVLREVDFIICEDTRVTSILLKHYEISKDLISLNAFSERFKIEKLIDRLAGGEKGALVSDAGTPGISDPGARLISASIKNGIEVSAVPGVSAVITALSISGLPTDSFVYYGFLPIKKGRQKKLQAIREETRTVVIYESVHRIEKLVKEFSELFPERTIVVCRELTKKFEEIWRGKASDLFSSLNDKTIKGEFVVLIAPQDWTED
ncbi:MAG TPA: 16S rRNA (cytidine(1402)-2'-O)-methyltransferase [Ignavibacteriaceae bacterium]|nr:16S rRNA (cytidine(1402)-2'-O)-methyltransferase [Ignavibacteriaceae bacterium]